MYCLKGTSTGPPKFGEAGPRALGIKTSSDSLWPQDHDSIRSRNFRPPSSTGSNNANFYTKDSFKAPLQTPKKHQTPESTPNSAEIPIPNFPIKHQTNVQPPYLPCQPRLNGTCSIPTTRIPQIPRQKQQQKPANNITLITSILDRSRYVENSASCGQERWDAVRTPAYFAAVAHFDDWNPWARAVGSVGGRRGGEGSCPGAQT